LLCVERRKDATSPPSKVFIAGYSNPSEKAALEPQIHSSALRLPF
jgi:hypothetical protein